MKKRLLSLGMALCIVLTLVPISAFAEENSEVQTCICETVCTKETRNTDCPVCSAENATPEVCTYSPPVTYTVTYKDAEGSNSFNPQTDVVNAGAETPEFKGTLNREGFLFDGWDPAVAETVTADATYTAKWAEAVTITYKDGKDGAIFEEKSIKVKKGDATPAYTLNSSYTSWTFKEWDPAVEETATTDATYTAQWEKKGANKLVLNANHSSITSNATSESTSEASSIAIPVTSWSVEENELNGWNTQADGKGTSYSKYDTVNFDGPHNDQTITLYAQWVSVAEKPTYNAGDILNGYKVKIAVSGDDTFSIEKDASGLLSMSTLKGNDADGYTLELTLYFGATLEAQCKTAINEHYTSTGETTKTGDWRFYATDDHPKIQTVSFKWDADNERWIPPEGTTGSVIATFYMNQYFTVTYTDGMNGNCFRNQTTSVAKDAATPTFNGTPTRTGYTFKGWDKEVAQTVTADVTYTARWEAKTYTVTFDPNGGTGTMADQTLTYDKAEKLTKNAFTRKGYKFIGWMDQTGTTYDDEEEVTHPDPSEKGIYLHARWKPSVERVDFSLTGYGYKKEITSVSLSYDADNWGVSYGDNYKTYGDNYGITTDSSSTDPLSKGTFREETDYFLYVTFYVNRGYTHEDLTKEDVFLNGVPAISLTGNKEDRPATQNSDGEVNPGTQLTAVFELKTIYLIKASAGKNGTITPEGTVAVFEGDDVTFTITPNDGYAIADVKVDGKSFGAVKTYTFENVQASHTIEAVFMKATGNPQTGVDVPFTDVSENDWFYEDVAYVYANDLMKGTSERDRQRLWQR